MKKENISKILSNIDEKYTQEASLPVKKTNSKVHFAVIAASLAFVIIAGAVLSQTDFIRLYTEHGETTISPSEAYSPEKPGIEIATTPAIEIATEGELAILRRWEELSASEKFPEVKTENNTYSTTATPIAEEYILEFLSDTSLSGYDLYEDKTYTETGKLYSIKNISTDCATAVRIGTENTYYVYVNSNYSPKTLGAFINDIDLKNTVVFGAAYEDTYEYKETSSSHTRKTYEDFDDSIIWEMLLTATEAENTEYNQPYNGIDIVTNLPLLGYKNISFDVTTDGYIITNILNTQKCFFIGTEKTDAFAAYLEKNVPFTAHTDVYEFDNNISGSGEVVSPGFNPDEPVTTPAFDPQWENNNSSEFIPGNAGSTTPAPVPEDFIVVETTQIR